MTTLLLPERLHARSATLELWIARGDRLADATPGNEALLRGAFAFDGRFAPAALTRQRDVGDAGETLWLRADPAWLRADMTTVRMFAHGNLGLSTGEIAALTPDLAKLFAEYDLRFDAPTSTRWYVACPASMSIPEFPDPDRALGDDLRLHTLSGSEGKFWRVLDNDIQVLLHNHSVNHARIAKGAAPVNGLWLWGGGRFPNDVSSDADGYFGDDAVALALAGAASVATSAVSAFPDSVTVRHAIVDLRGLRGGALAAALDAAATTRLNHGKSAINLAFASGERYRYKPSQRWRFWRRLKRVRD